jgi:hypothetical protein
MGIPKEYVWLFLVSVFLQEILDRVIITYGGEER